MSAHPRPCLSWASRGDMQAIAHARRAFPTLCTAWSCEWASNPRPADYKSAALPTELSQHSGPLRHARSLTCERLRAYRGPRPGGEDCQVHQRPASSGPCLKPVLCLEDVTTTAPYTKQSSVHWRGRTDSDRLFRSRDDVLPLHYNHILMQTAGIEPARRQQLLLLPSWDGVWTQCLPLGYVRKRPITRCKTVRWASRHQRKR